ncbi:hypothetical protein [Frankia sp. AgB32]|uniref:hypothetical protein n=1 Tax=Frankia sp. AgB32 TaxID=631119 RepID=UPI00200D4B75|nr:hypothetical protein [Frankia sp. AgB32]MCK9895220.1 hypothetical protein [Frankia sp. AgB32]
MIRSTRHRATELARRLLTTAAARVLAAVQPAPTAAAPTKASTPLFAEAEMPAVAEIEATGDVHQAGAEARRAGNRSVDRAKKLLERLPDGVYGRVTIAREESSRMVVDLDAVAATYRQHGLGEVPMRRCAPTLRVTVAPAVVLPAGVELAVAA